MKLLTGTLTSFKLNTKRKKRTRNTDGKIAISFKRSAENQNRLILTVADNGVGIPPDFDFINHSTIGMNLMKGLSEDIDGIFTIQNKEGTVINMDFTYTPDIPKDFTATLAKQNFTT